MHPDTTCTVNNVKVYGGDTRDLTIINKPSWIHPAPETDYNPATGIFTFSFTTFAISTLILCGAYAVGDI